jgi:hypothetical protein
MGELNDFGYSTPTTGTFVSRDIWAGEANQPMSYNRLTGNHPRCEETIKNRQVPKNGIPGGF